MGRVITSKGTGRTEILVHADCTAVTVTVSAESIPANENGKKIAKAGTIVAGKEAPALKSKYSPVVETNDAGAEGVLRYDVDVTHGDREGSMVIRGDVAINKIPTEPTEEAIAALKDIIFIRR